MSDNDTTQTTGVIGKCKRLLPKQGFARNVMVLAGGTAFAQGLLVLASPILTRLYSPEDFGTLAAYVSILSILAVVVSWRYELAIPLPEDEVDAANLMVLSLVILFVMSIFTGIAVWLAGDMIVQRLKVSAIKPYLWFLPVSLFGVGLYKILSYWAVRNKAFSRISRTKVNQSLGQVATQLIIGFMHSGPLGLLLGDVIGRISGSGTLARQVVREDKKALIEVSLPGMHKVANTYRKFPLLSSGSALINSAGLQAPPLLFAAFYGPQIAGWFVLGQKVISIPMILVGQAVAQVYVGEISRLVQNNPSEMHRLFLYTAKKLLYIGVIPTAILALFGSGLFSLVFGESWRQAGGYTQLLSLMLLVQLITVPLSQTLNVLEKQTWQLAWDIFRLVIVVSGILVPYKLGWSPSDAVLLYGLGMLFTYGMLLVISHYAIIKRKNG